MSDAYERLGMMDSITFGGGVKATKDAFGRVTVSAEAGGDVYTKAEVDQKIEAIELTPGPQGPQGPQGATGPQGPKGDPGTSVTVDTVLSATSTNPVQNKVIQAKIADLESRIAALEAPAS